MPQSGLKAQPMPMAANTINIARAKAILRVLSMWSVPITAYILGSTVATRRLHSLTCYPKINPCCRNRERSRAKRIRLLLPQSTRRQTKKYPNVSHWSRKSSGERRPQGKGPRLSSLSLPTAAIQSVHLAVSFARTYTPIPKQLRDAVVENRRLHSSSQAGVFRPTVVVDE